LRIPVGERLRCSRSGLRRAALGLCCCGNAARLLLLRRAPLPLRRLGHGRGEIGAERRLESCRLDPRLLELPSRGLAEFLFVSVRLRGLFGGAPRHLLHPRLGLLPRRGECDGMAFYKPGLTLLRSGNCILCLLLERRLPLARLLRGLLQLRRPLRR